MYSANDLSRVADIFGSGDSSQTVAQQWLDKYRADDAAAMADLVNCILQCAGCDLAVTVDDIRDPENIPNRLVDLQNEYQEVGPFIWCTNMERVADNSTAKHHRLPAGIPRQRNQIVPRYACFILRIAGRAHP